MYFMFGRRYSRTCTFLAIPMIAFTWRFMIYIFLMDCHTVIIGAWYSIIYVLIGQSLLFCKSTHVL